YRRPFQLVSVDSDVGQRGDAGKYTGDRERDADLDEAFFATRVLRVHRVGESIEICRPSDRVGEGALERVPAGQATGGWVIVPGAQVIEPHVWVELLASEEIEVACAAGLSQESAVRVVHVAISHGSLRVGQCANASQAVHVVERLHAAPVLQDQ